MIILELQRTTYVICGGGGGGGIKTLSISTRLSAARFTAVVIGATVIRNWISSLFCDNVRIQLPQEMIETAIRYRLPQDPKRALNLFDMRIADVKPSVCLFCAFRSRKSPSSFCRRKFATPYNRSFRLRWGAREQISHRPFRRDDSDTVCQPFDS